VPNNSIPFPLIYQDKNPRKPPIPEVEAVLSQTSKEIQGVVQCLNKKKAPMNFHKMDIARLKCLKDKGLVVISSDKGGEFVVLENAKYQDAMTKHLADPKTYRRVSFNDPAKIEERLNEQWNKVCKARKLPKQIADHYKSTNSKFATVRGLIKTHKDGPEIQIRPIVNLHNSPTYKLTHFLSSLLQPLFKTCEYQIENTIQLMEKLDAILSASFSSFQYPISLDIKSMYTSIPTIEAIAVVMTRLSRSDLNLHTLLPVDIKALLDTIFGNSFVTFGGKYI
jgi:hypothetical protein